MKFITLLLSLSLFVICVHAQKLPQDLLQKIASQVRITTLVQLPLPFQSKRELGNRLVRFMNDGYFEGGKNPEAEEMFKDPNVVPTLNKIYDLLSTKLGTDGMSRKGMLEAFPVFKIKPNEEEWEKNSAFRVLFKQILSGTLRPLFALFWVEDLDVADIILYNPLFAYALIQIPYQQGISDEEWSNRIINERLQGFPITQKQKQHLINQKHTLKVCLLELWLMKFRKFPIKNKKIISEVKINGQEFSLSSFVTGLTNSDYSKNFIKISNEIVQPLTVEVNTQIGDTQNDLDEMKRSPDTNKDQIALNTKELEKLKGLLDWLLKEQNK